MKYKRLGRCGINVSEICLGTMGFGDEVDEPTANKIIKKAVDLGINFVDTANVYAKGKSEEIVGRAIKGMRESLVLATKVRHGMGPGPNDEGLSRKHIMHQVQESLRRLDTNYIDILYLHRPSNVDMMKGFVGEPVPLEETLGALTDLVRWGKVHYIGCSNFPAWLHCKALWTSDVHDFEKIVVSQPRYNLLQREIEREIIPLCVDQGIGIVPYSPLAGGSLTGKYKAGSPPPEGSRGAIKPGFFPRHGFHWEDPHNLKVIQGLEAFSKEIGKPMAQIALAWMLANPAITSPIIAATSIKQLEENLAATELSLNKSDLGRIDQIAPVLGPYFT
ncbi:MAG: aldo/keto reductase [Nitrososphaeria archaeon]|jgi:aryl-alcohol dehydrogenase-like predicted oxidoreductase